MCIWPRLKRAAARAAVFLALSLAVSSAAWALQIPPRPDSYVNDYAGLMTPAARQALEEALGRFERETSNQLVIAIFQSLEGGSLEDFSIHLAEQWKVGQKEKNNGVILVIFKDDRKVRIEVGYGLEGALPDILADKIIRNEITPRFREGRYDEGVTAAANAILAATKGEYAPAAGGEDPIKNYAPIIYFALIFYFFVPILAYLLAIFICAAMFGFPAGLFAGIFIASVLMFLRHFIFANYVGQTYSRRGAGWYGGTGGWGGGGGFGGGFGGGGGGSFGGGGASGGW